MLNQLESLFAKSGARVLGLGIMLLIVSSTSSMISEEFGLATVCLGIILIGASFVTFRGNVYGYQKRVDAVASQSVNSSKLDSFIIVCWLSFVALPFGVLLLKLTGIAEGPNFYDFGAYYNAGERVINGYPLYDWTTSYPEVTNLPNAPDRYLYAPLISLLFAPFAYLPYGVSTLSWMSLSVFAYLSGITVFLRSLDIEIPLKHWLVIWTGVLGFGPFVVTFIAGQITAIVTGLFCVAGASLHRQRNDSGSSGAILAIPVAIKAYYAPVCAPLLRERRHLFTAASAIAALVVGGLLIFGVDTTASYLRVLANGKGWGEAINPPKIWNINDFHPFYYFGDVSYVFRGVILSIIAAVSYQSRQYDFEYINIYVFSLGLLGVVLGAPTLATSGILVLIPAILFLLVTTYRDRPVVFGLVLTSALLVHIHPYTNEFLTSIILPNIRTEWPVAAVIPVVQPAAWGVFLLSACVTYEYSRRIEMEADDPR